MPLVLLSLLFCKYLHTCTTYKNGVLAIKYNIQEVKLEIQTNIVQDFIHSVHYCCLILYKLDWIDRF
jgi:hypothetical protein